MIFKCQSIQKKNITHLSLLSTIHIGQLHSLWDMTKTLSTVVLNITQLNRQNISSKYDLNLNFIQVI